MAVIQKKVAVAANTTNKNILSGEEFEFLPFHAQVTFGFNQSATGLEIDVHTGQDLLCKALEPLISATYPNNDEMDFVDIVAAGERLTVQVRNTTAGSLDCYARILIDPVIL